MPGYARLHELAAGDRAPVRPGELLLALESAEVSQQHDAATAKAQRLQWEAEAAGVVPKWREQNQVVRERRRQIVPEHAVYHVTLAPAEPYDPRTPQETRGHLVIFGEPAAPLAELAQSTAAVFRREAGF